MTRAVGRQAAITTDYADLRDAANGEPVPRCEVCGVAGVEKDGDWVTAVEGHRFYRGLWVYLRVSFPDDRCGPCLQRRIDRLPQNVDPLTLDEVA